jgi:hypothetical protein
VTEKGRLETLIKEERGLDGGIPITEAIVTRKGGDGSRRVGKGAGSGRIAPERDHPNKGETPNELVVRILILRCSDRLDEARIVVLDVADARAHRPADHFIGRVGG